MTVSPTARYDGLVVELADESPTTDDAGLGRLLQAVSVELGPGRTVGLGLPAPRGSGVLAAALAKPVCNGHACWNSFIVYVTKSTVRDDAALSLAADFVRAFTALTPHLPSIAECRPSGTWKHSAWRLGQRSASLGDRPPPI